MAWCAAAFRRPWGVCAPLTRFGFAPDGPQKVRRWLREATVTVEGERLPMALAMERTDPAAPVYAVSGTATSLASFAAGATNAYRAEAVNGLLLSKKKIEEILAELSALTPQERLRHSRAERARRPHSLRRRAAFGVHGVPGRNHCDGERCR